MFSYYIDAANPYFPSGSIDLRYGISAELIKEKDKSKDPTYFTVTTDKRTYYFKADSEQSAKEWVKQLQKVIFRSHNDGDSIKISLPIDNIIDVEENPVIDFAETIKIRVIDNDETYAVDEYFFSFFSFGKDALEVLKVMTQDSSAQKALGGPSMSPAPSRRPSITVRKGSRLSMQLPDAPIQENVRATLSPMSPISPRVSGEFNRSTSFNMGRRSMDRGRQSFDKGRRSVSAASAVSFSRSRRGDKSPLSQGEKDETESYFTSSEHTHQSATIESLGTSEGSASQILSGSGVFSEPTLRKPPPQRSISGATINRLRRESQDTARSPSREHVRVHPPTRSQTEQSLLSRPSLSRNQTIATEKAAEEQAQKSSYSDSSALSGLMRAYPFRASAGFAGYIKSSGKRVTNLLGTSPMGYYEKVSGMLAGHTKHYTDADALMGEDHVHDADDDIDGLEAGRRFREHFALPDTEKLEAAYFGSLQRVLPLYGKIYIGSRTFCFRSLLPGTRTKLVVPIKDILNVNKEKSFRWGRPGMVVVIRGHEEIFFEFKSTEIRDDCTVTVLRSLDRVRFAHESVIFSQEEKEDAEVAAAENELLQEARQDGYADHDIQLPRKIDQTGTQESDGNHKDYADRSAEPDAPTILFDDPAASVLDFKPQESLRITCLTIGSRGDVQPYIALCKGLLAEGHKPKIATHGEFEPWVRKHGIDFAPVEGDPAELMRICVENGMFTPSFLYEANTKVSIALLRARYIANNVQFRVFVEKLLTTAWTACQDSDLLVESPSAMAGIHIAEALGIPYFRAFTMPWTRTRAYPHAFAVPNHKMGGAYNYMTYVLFDNIFWQSTASQVNRWRRKTLGLRPTHLDKLQINKVPFLYNFSPSVVVPPLDFSHWIRVTGYWFLDEGNTNWTPQPGLLAFIKKARDDNMPLVYIGFGSVVVSDSAQMTQNIISAVLKADVRCILSKGWSDRLDKKDANVSEVPLPDCIFQISSAPHDWLFRQIDAAVHHGGAGTTGASLRAGVPTIIKPFFGDQFFFGSRVEDLGVGIHIKRVTENTLGRALWIATHDERMKEKARVLGEQIRSEDGVGNAIKAIYRDMEYARTLIKKREPLTGNQASNEGDDDDVDADAEESWTFVEGDSDPEPTSPTIRSSMTGFTWDEMRSRSGSRRTSGMALGSLALKGSGR